MPTQENWFDCLVCGNKTRFFHLNAKICRACSSFYRRAITENLTYTCKFDGNCRLDNPDTKCRSCRFHQCQAAGAHLTVSQIDQLIVEQPTSSANDIHKNQPKLDELLKGYDLFLMAQRTLFSVKHPELGITGDKLIRPKKKLLIKMEIESIPLVLRFFHDSFGPFKQLGKTQKVNLTIEAFDDFALLHKVALTLQYFPNLEDERIMHTNGYYTVGTPEDSKWFFEGYLLADKIQDYEFIIGPMRSKIVKNVNKARLLKLRRIDLVAMMALALWKRVEQANLLTDQMNAYKEELIEEWMESLREEYNEHEITKRFTQIMMYYFESDDLVSEMNKSKTVLRVYWLRNDEDDLCDIQAAMKKLDLGQDDE